MVILSIKEVIINGVIAKSKKYPWMETFFITDEEIIESSGGGVSKGRINRVLKSSKPVFSLDEVQRYKGKKISKYAFNSWKLAERVKVKRNGDNTEFFSRALNEYFNL